MLKKRLLSLSLLSLSACNQVPDFPAIWQCAYDGSPRAFYCVNTETKERLKISAGAPEMKGAQCLSIPDYQRSEAWVAQVKRLAEENCK